jgi:hypothetical protein
MRLEQALKFRAFHLNLPAAEVGCRKFDVVTGGGQCPANEKREHKNATSHPGCVVAKPLRRWLKLGEFNSRQLRLTL